MKRTIQLSFILVLLTTFAVAQSYTVTLLGPSTLNGSVGNAINALGAVAGGAYPPGDVTNEFGYFWTPSGSSSKLAPIAGGYSSYATGVNQKGQIVGQSTFDTSGSVHAVLWTNGTVRDLGTLPGGDSSFGTGINASGEIVGASDTTNSLHAITWTASGGMRDLGVFPGGTVSYGEAINKVGQVVGYSNTANGVSFGFIWSQEKGMQNLGSLPSGGGSTASAINNLGQIAGTSNCGGTCLHAVLWSKTAGTIQDLGTLPGSTGSSATGINNKGQVVGGTYGLDHAFIWSQTTGMQDLNDLIPANSGWVLGGASAINDNGQITGQGEYQGVKYVTFLLTPVN